MYKLYLAYKMYFIDNKRTLRYKLYFLRYPKNFVRNCQNKYA